MIEKVRRRRADSVIVGSNESNFALTSSDTEPSCMMVGTLQTLSAAVSLLTGIRDPASLIRFLKKELDILY